MHCHKALLLIALLMPLTVVASQRYQDSLGQRYQASLEQSQWHLNGSPIRCELSHPIPRYGEGRFVYSAGGELAFEVHVLLPFNKDSVASMLSVPPFWKTGESRELAQLSLTKGKMPFYVSQDLAMRMLYELDAGWFPTLRYMSLYDQTVEVTVSLSSANFHDELQRFQDCIGNLLPEGLEGLKDAVIQYGNNLYQLSQQDKVALKNIALFANLDKTFKLHVEGHTDNKGSRRYNRRLSERRVKAVIDYLIKAGVSRGRITSRAFGERKPASKNSFSDGRAMNRRVVVNINR